MQKRILFMLILGVGVLACAQVFAGPTTEVKSSPLFQASLEVSIAKLEGTPVAEAGAVAEDAENEADTHRPNCPKPGKLETDGSGNTCQSSCNGTCGSTCGGSNSCSSTCSSTCGSTCVGGTCKNYGFSGTISWSHQNGNSGNNWWQIDPANLVPGGGGHNVAVRFDDESSLIQIATINYNNGWYSGSRIRTTTTVGAYVNCSGWMANTSTWTYYPTGNGVQRNGPLSSTSTNYVSFSIDVTYPF